MEEAALSHESGDEQLEIERARAGDLDAFNSLIRRYEDQVFSVAYRMVGNEDDAADIAQEVFISWLPPPALLSRRFETVDVASPHHDQYGQEHVAPSETPGIRQNRLARDGRTRRRPASHALDRRSRSQPAKSGRRE